MSFQDDVLVVSVSTTFSKAHLETRYTDLIRSLLAEITGNVVDVRFVVAHELPDSDEEVVSLLPPSSPLPAAPKRSGYRLSRGRLGALRPGGGRTTSPEVAFANSAP